MAKITENKVNQWQTDGKYAFAILPSVCHVLPSRKMGQKSMAKLFLPSGLMGI